MGRNYFHENFHENEWSHETLFQIVNRMEHKCNETEQYKIMLHNERKCQIKRLRYEDFVGSLTWVGCRIIPPRRNCPQLKESPSVNSSVRPSNRPLSKQRQICPVCIKDGWPFELTLGEEYVAGGIRGEELSFSPWVWYFRKQELLTTTNTST